MTISKKERWVMFNAISKTYDRVNRLMTFGLDVFWRKALVQSLPVPCDTVLDLASGTMDVAIAIQKNRPDIRRIIALDMARNMLDIGVKKCADAQIDSIEPLVADVHKLPFNESEFEAVTVSFGIRNFERLSCAFEEAYRVLKPGGVFLILESCQPKKPLLRWLQGMFLHGWVRLVGRLVSGHSDSYAYLAATIQAFDSTESLSQALTQAGFKTVTHRFFTLQSVQLIYAVK